MKRPTRKALSLGASVARARRRAGYKTIYEMHRATGYSPGHLRDIESGVSSPSVKSLERIARLLGLELDLAFRKPRK